MKLTQEQLKLIKDLLDNYPQLTDDCIKLINNNLPNHLFFHKEHLKIIQKAFQDNMSLEQIQILADTDFHNTQMEEIYEGFKNGLSIEQVIFYAKPSFDCYYMKQIRLLLEKNTPIQQISQLTSTEFNTSQINTICRFLTSSNISNIEQILLFAKHEFNDKQMNEIVDGFGQGLTIEQVSVYADPKFSYEQMREIKLGFKNGLTEEQIMIYANPKFNHNQMEQIRLGFENGLSTEQILLYAKSWIYSIHMEQMRLGLEHGLTKEQVLSYSLLPFAPQVEVYRIYTEKGWSTDSLKKVDWLNIEKSRVSNVKQMIELGFPENAVSMYLNKKIREKQLEELMDIARHYSVEHAMLFINSKLLDVFLINRMHRMLSYLHKDKFNNMQDEQKHKISLKIIKTILTEKDKEIVNISDKQLQEFADECFSNIIKQNVNNLFSNLQSNDLKLDISIKSFKI